MNGPWFRPLGGSPLMFLTSRALAGLGFAVGRKGVENAFDFPGCAWGLEFGPNKGQVRSRIWESLGAPEQAAKHHCYTDHLPSPALAACCPQAGDVSPCRMNISLVVCP